ncbi:hypothetical protein HKX48_004023 [Thoreauomyces humboldtii]|nr:hypothetical protein HKX48_004023 [Thoreauomyces humboldtii]
MSSYVDPKYMEPSALVALMEDSSQVAGADYVVVDGTPLVASRITPVRDDDFAHGNILHAVNIPSRDFLEHPAEHVERFRDVPKVVFHCALSQVRGPKCAKRFAEALSKGEKTAVQEGKSPQEVFILRGGFENWQSGLDRRHLIEAYNEEYWKAPW